MLKIKQQRKQIQMITLRCQPFSSGGSSGSYTKILKRALMAFPIVAVVPIYYKYLNEGSGNFVTSTAKVKN